MPPSSSLHTIGFYCGRHGSGLFDEVQNSFSNAAFVVGAMLAYRAWRNSADRDRLLLALMLMLAAIGVGSFVFHSHPTPVTLYIDLVPIQIYVLAVLGYALNRYLAFSWKTTALVLAGFFLVRQMWILVVPKGLLGGGVTHVPTLLALLIAVAVLARRKIVAWKYLVAGAAFYSIALVVRTLDIPLCAAFPLGLHWLWHLLTALAATSVLVGLVRSPRQGRGAA